MIPGLTSKLSEAILVAATSISPKTDLVRLTGATQIETIVPAYGGGFSGVLFLVSTSGAVTLGTTGNILVGQVLAVNRLYMLVFSRLANKWYIHGIV